ncbi:MAG TPA: ATP-binding cassette domain-containing protein [Bacillota bacterium]|nr:ATP-binding cassette domain-containing protein [Bacillota bacterium]
MIKLYNLGFQIGHQTILDHIDLEFKAGETFVIMGPSGCGKSTLLRLIMGLIKPTSGWIEIDGTNTLTLDRNGWQQLRQKMGMVFQSAALFDSLTVYDNIAFGLRRRRMDESTIRKKVTQALMTVDLDPAIADKMPADLSGGMKKRTAIARAIAIEPPILLYDEPTTGLDPIVAGTINDLICNLQKKLGITSIVVTHDVISALTVADRVGLLHEGRLAELRERPDLKNATHPLLKEFLRDYHTLL